MVVDEWGDIDDLGDDDDENHIAEVHPYVYGENEAKECGEGEDDNDIEFLSETLEKTSIYPKFVHKRIRPDCSVITQKDECIDLYLQDTLPGMEFNDNKISLIASTKEGHSVHINVTGFKPYFYLLADENTNWTDVQEKMVFYALGEAINDKVYRDKLEKAQKRMQQAINEKDYAVYEKAKKEHERVTTKGRLDILPISRVDKVRGLELEGYHDIEQVFYKIETAYPRLVAECRMMFEFPMGGKPPGRQYVEKWWPNNIPLPEPFNEHKLKTGKDGEAAETIFYEYFKVFEADIKYTHRFNTDCGMKPCGWFKVNLNDAIIITADSVERTSRCDIELILDYTKLLTSDMSSAQVPPRTTFSFDIECSIPENKKFPTPYTSYITQLAVFKVFDKKEIKSIFCLKECGEVPAADEVFYYESEKELIMDWICCIQAGDPDLIIGYNINGFDTNFMIKRMKLLGIPEECIQMSRFFCKTTLVSKLQKVGTRQRVAHTMYLPGRTQLDIMVETMNTSNRKSYSLQSVAMQVLNTGKADIDIMKLNELNRTKEGRTEICNYCVIDSVLPFQIMEKNKLYTSLMQMAFVTGVTVNDLIGGGQQAKILSILLSMLSSKTRLRYMFRTQPTYRIIDPEKYEGAALVPPRVGLYLGYTTTLDFTSLYPSIMIQFNICVSTKVTTYFVQKYNLREGIHHRTMPEPTLVDGRLRAIINPNNPKFFQTQQKAAQCFVKEYKVKDAQFTSAQDGLLILSPGVSKALEENGWKYDREYTIINHVDDQNVTHKVVDFRGCKVGFLIDVLKYLLKARSDVKKEMAKYPEGSPEWIVLNARQLAIKASANSVYGMTGATTFSKLPDKDVASSVTSWGRLNINMIVIIASMWFCHDNGFPFCLEVIYGDTDSIFVLFTKLLQEMYIPGTDTINEELIFDYSANISEYITEKLDMPFLKLAYEKTFRGFLLISKKKYAGMKIIPEKIKDRVPGGPKYKYEVRFAASGVESVRKDSSVIVSHTIDKCLKLMLEGQNIVGAMNYAREVIRDINMDKLSMGNYIVTRGLSKMPEDYKALSPHVMIAMKNGNANVGDKINYIIRDGHHRSKVSELAVTAEQAFLTGVPVNRKKYLGLLLNSLMRIMVPALCNKPILEIITRHDITSKYYNAWTKKWDQKSMESHIDNLLSQFDNATARMKESQNYDTNSEQLNVHYLPLVVDEFLDKSELQANKGAEKTHNENKKETIPGKKRSLMDILKPFKDTNLRPKKKQNMNKDKIFAFSHEKNNKRKAGDIDDSTDLSVYDKIKDNLKKLKVDNKKNRAEDAKRILEDTLVRDILTMGTQSTKISRSHIMINYEDKKNFGMFVPASRCIICHVPVASKDNAICSGCHPSWIDEYSDLDLMEEDIRPENRKDFHAARKMWDDIIEVKHNVYLDYEKFKAAYDASMQRCDKCISETETNNKCFDRKKVISECKNYACDNLYDRYHHKIQTNKATQKYNLKW